MKIRLRSVVLALLITISYQRLISREDCMGSIYQDKHGVWRPNPELTLLTEQSRCLCSCTGQRTQAGKCIDCRHSKDYRTAKKFAQTCCKSITYKKRLASLT